MNKTQAIIRASAHYLTDPIPEEFFDWDYNKQNDFLQDYAWEPFEDCAGEELYRRIDNLALDMMNIAHEKKCEECGYDMGENYENCGASEDGVCPECHTKKKCEKTIDSPPV